MEHVEVIVIGAGAAGLWAAARAAEGGRDVLVLEKTRRTGTKVLMSGGTRCNLTTTLGVEEALRTFGPRGERFLRRAFRALPPAAVRARFAELGVPTVEAPLDKVFPASDRARDVRDALERWARAAGARIETEVAVASLRREGDEWTIVDAGGEEWRADSVVLAVGGRSYARCGTTGDGYGWLANRGLPLVATRPALVPLTSPAPWVHELAGIALAEVEVRLVEGNGKVRGKRARPIVFTHQGISGPGAMDVARSIDPDATPEGGWWLVLDLVPGTSREDLRAMLIEGAGRPGQPILERMIRNTLPLPVPRRLVRAALGQAGLEGRERGPATLSKSERHAVIEALKGLEAPVDGTLGFDHAEVTAGGLDLRAVDPGTMGVRGHAGLYAVGEILDLDGPIGGLNFQAAFATAEVAGRALAADD